MVFVSLIKAILLFLLALQTGRIPYVLAAGQQCYFRNGQPAGASHKPCWPEQANSSCCAIAKTNDAENDICLYNGLCYSQDGIYSGLIYMNTCTDPSWKSRWCPEFCDSVPVKNDGNRVYNMIPCLKNGTGEWCCSKSGEDCCASASPVTMSTLALSTLTQSASATSMPPTSTPTNINEIEECNDSKAKATAIGAGVGVSLGTCLLATIAAIIFQYYIHKKRLQRLRDELALQVAAGAEPMQHGQANSLQPPSEIGSSLPPELGNTSQPIRYELGSQQH